MAKLRTAENGLITITGVSLTLDLLTILTLLGRLYRYIRLIVNVVASWTFRPIPIPQNPTYSPDDVTILIPTLEGSGEEFEFTLKRCLANKPREIIVITVKKNLTRLEDVAARIDPNRIRVLAVPRPSKRKQLVEAIPQVRTKICVLADDDVIWPEVYLPWILAPFEDEHIGGAGTSQRLLRPAPKERNVWSFLGALYLERRNFEISATTHMDGGVSCLSGRTVAYRTKILQDPAFQFGFTHELWNGKHELNADDDNFITRWIVSHGWNSYEQCIENAELQTTLMNDSRFLKQCLRWARSNWRSNITSMFKERHIWRRQIWCSYALHLATFSPPAFVTDPFHVWICYKAFARFGSEVQSKALTAMLVWVLFTKIVKTLPHYILYPQDLLYFPVSILFGWFHGLIKIYACFTMNETSWGSREGADDYSDAFDSESSVLINEKLHVYSN